MVEPQQQQSTFKNTEAERHTAADHVKQSRKVSGLQDVQLKRLYHSWEPRRRSHRSQVSHIIHWLSHRSVTWEQPSRPTDSEPEGGRMATGHSKSVERAQRQNLLGSSKSWRTATGGFKSFFQMHNGTTSWFYLLTCKTKKRNFLLCIWQNSWGLRCFFLQFLPSYMRITGKLQNKPRLPCFLSQRSTQQLQAVFLSPHPRTHRGHRSSADAVTAAPTARDKAVSAFLLWTLLSELIVSDNNMIWVKSFQQATLRYKCVNISTKVIFIHLSFYSFLTLESILQWNKQILFSSHPLLVPARDWL